MKKIMKKALSLVLALVMVLSLAPVTAMAADGSTTDPATLAVDGSENTCTVEGSAAYYYVYTATTDGVLSFAPVGDDVWLEFFKDAINYGGYAGSADFPCGADNPTTLDVVAGSTYYIAAKTSSMNSGTVSFTVTFAEGASSASGDSMDTAIDATNATNITVPARSTKYFYVTGTYQYGGEYTLTVDGGIAAGMNGGVGVASLFNGNEVASATGDTAASVLAIGMMVNGGSIYFAVTNPGFYDCSYTISVVDGAPAIGGPGSSASDPDTELTVGELVSLDLDGNEHWYAWTATEAGTFSFTMLNNLCADGWVYQVDGYSPYSTGWGEDDKNVCEVQLAAGETVIFGVWVPTYVEQYDSWDCYTAATGTICFNTAFTAGTSSDDDLEDDEDDDRDITEGEITAGEGDYAVSTAPIYVGNNVLEVSNMYTYTVFTFEPVSEGAYTFTMEDGVLGIVSYNGLWVQTEPTANTITETSVKWECTGVGQSIWLALAPNTNVANLTVEYTALEDTSIPEYIVCVSSEAYVFTGNVDDLKYVDIEATTENVVVEGEDGYLHLNTADGPILLVNLFDDILSLGAATETQKVVTSYDDNEDGKVDYTYNWNEAIIAYTSCADEATGLYPLTAELEELYKTYGEQQGWYTTSGYVGSQFSKELGEDAWMFACYYVPNAEDGTIVVPPVVVTPEVNEEGKVEAIEKEELEVAIESAKEEGKDLVIQTSNEKVTIVIVNEDLADATVMELDVTVETVADVKDETVAKAEEITANNFVLKVEFAHDGKLPAKVEISIEVGDAYANKTLYYYEILADGTLKYVCDAPVDANGNAKVAQDHCSDYVLLTEKLVAKTGDNTNIALWFAVLGLGVVAIAGSVVMRKREF